MLGCITVRAEVTTNQDAGTLISISGHAHHIKRMERLGDTMHIIAQGTDRIKVVEWKRDDPYLRAVVEILPEVEKRMRKKSKRLNAMCRRWFRKRGPCCLVFLPSQSCHARIS